MRDQIRFSVMIRILKTEKRVSEVSLKEKNSLFHFYLEFNERGGDKDGSSITIVFLFFPATSKYEHLIIWKAEVVKHAKR